LIVKGTIQDHNAIPVGYATVLLKTKDSAYATALSDTTGSFQLAIPAPGKYFLRITALGFRELVTESFEIDSASPSRDLGIVKLIPETKDLANVTVTALRPTITQLPDRMVVSIEGTAMAQGNTAFSLLSKSPGVSVDAEGNIQLNGSSGVNVMIDGRRSYLSARELRSLLESMPAENIKNIEIITNPSSRFDAEGTAGILNINLKKNTMQGINGSVYTNYSYNFYKQHNVSVGGNINFKTGRWNAFLNTDLARREGGRNATFTRIFKGNTTTYFDQSATGAYLSTGPPTFRGGADYTINENHSIGFVAGYVNSKGKSEFLTDTYISSNRAAPQQYIEADNFNTNTYTNITGNLHYNGKLDTGGTSISADMDYVKITNRGEAFLNNYFTDLATGNSTSDILYNHTPNGYDIYSARLDFTKPYSPENKIEAGLKASSINSDNDYRFYFNNSGKVLDITRTNHFKYDEQIYAAYLNWNGRISKKITMQAGLRAEQTRSLGNSLTAGIRTSRKYTDLFPSIFFQQTVSEHYGINYSYGRRL
ncbi:MAG TPA: outer membrane beta-barrel protein, partial [Chitinophagaceae bacterium]